MTLYIESGRPHTLTVARAGAEIFRTNYPDRGSADAALGIISPLYLDCEIRLETADAILITLGPVLH